MLDIRSLLSLSWPRHQPMTTAIIRSRTPAFGWRGWASRRRIDTQPSFDSQQPIKRPPPSCSRLTLSPTIGGSHAGDAWEDDVRNPFVRRQSVAASENVSLIGLQAAIATGTRRPIKHRAYGEKVSVRTVRHHMTLVWYLLMIFVQKVPGTHRTRALGIYRRVIPKISPEKLFRLRIFVFPSMAEEEAGSKPHPSLRRRERTCFIITPTALEKAEFLSSGFGSASGGTRKGSHTPSPQTAPAKFLVHRPCSAPHPTVLL